MLLSCGISIRRDNSMGQKAIWPSGANPAHALWFEYNRPYDIF